MMPTLLLTCSALTYTLARKFMLMLTINQGISQGQTLVDWRNKLKQAANVNWVYDAKDQRDFDLFNRQLGLLK